MMNPFLSGDESDQWEAEEENIAAQVAMGNALEQLAALQRTTGYDYDGEDDGGGRPRQRGRW